MAHTTGSAHATTVIGRIAGQVYQLEGGEPMVAVWFVDGPQIGDYLLSRFEGGKLTDGTLGKMFASRNA